MYWFNAKKAVLTLLIIINLALLGLNYNESRRYYVSPARETAIFNMLAKENISIYSFVEEYSPTSTISVVPVILDRDSVLKMFFNGEQTGVTYEFDRTVLQGESKRASFKDNNVTLSYAEGSGMDAPFSEETATELARSFIAGVSGQSNRFAPTYSYMENGVLYIEFSEKYKGKPVYCSSYEIRVSERGIESADISFYDILGYDSGKNEIFGCDEALMSFLFYIRENWPERGSVSIEKIELGYDSRDYAGVNDRQKKKLAPCYRIFVMGRREPVLINAYTNEVL